MRSWSSSTVRARSSSQMMPVGSLSISSSSERTHRSARSGRNGATAHCDHASRATKPRPLRCSADASLVHSGPWSSCQGARHSTIVTADPLTSASSRTSFNASGGTRCSQKWRTAATSSPGSTQRTVTSERHRRLRDLRFRSRRVTRFRPTGRTTERPPAGPRTAPCSHRCRAARRP